jgi:hypothetical protein
MATELGSAYVVIRGDQSKMMGDMNAAGPALEKQGAGLGDLIGASIIKGVAGAVMGKIAQALGPALTDFGHWLDVSMKAESSMARFEGALKASGQAAGYTSAQLQAMATDVAALGAYWKQDVIDAESALLIFHDIQGTNFKETLTAAANLSAFMGQELPQAARLLGMALENPAEGFRRLRHEGVVFTTAQEQAIRQMAEAGNKAGAQRMILDAVGKAYGGMAETMAGTTEGKLRRIGNTWKDIGKSIGDAILPVLTTVTDFLQPILEGFGSSVSGFFNDMKEGGKSTFGAIADWIKENRTLLQTWGRYIGDTVTGGLKFMQSVAETVFKFIGGLFGINETNAAESWGKIKDSVTNALLMIDTAANNMKLTMKIVWNEISLFVNEQWDAMMQDKGSQSKAVMDGVWAYLKAGASAAIQNVMYLLGVAIEQGGPALKNLIDTYLTWGANDEDKAKAQKNFAKAMMDLGQTLAIDIEDPFNKNMKNIGETAGAAYWKAYNAEITKGAATDSPETARLRKEKAALAGEFAAAMEKQAADAAAKMQAALAKPGIDMTPHIPGAQNTLTVKFETTGLADQWKKVQESLGGDTVVSLQKATAQNTKEINEGQKGLPAAIAAAIKPLVGTVVAVAGP